MDDATTNDLPQPPRTTVVNRRVEPFDIYIGRGSIWGNPYTHLTGATRAMYFVGSRDEAIEKYREYLAQREDLLAQIADLKGKRLGCYCKPAACHGDILAELADAS